MNVQKRKRGGEKERITGSESKKERETNRENEIEIMERNKKEKAKWK